MGSTRGSLFVESDMNCTLDQFGVDFVFDCDMYAEFKMQIELGLRERLGWGGRRAGAGRPANKDGVRHVTRPKLSKHHPVLVTLRLARDIGNARRARVFKVIRSSLKAGREQFGFRL